MKQSDIFSIIIVATVGTLFSYFLVNSLLGDPDLAHADIKTIQNISASIDTPDPEFFNVNAINPTVEVFIGECKDIDGNNILSVDELRACGKIRDDDEDTERYYCPDGTEVLDESYCTQTNEQDELEGE